MDVRFHHPFTALLSGPTTSGKSFFISKFLKFRDTLVDVEFEKIVVYYTEFQENYKTMGPGYIEFCKGLPEDDDDDDTDYAGGARLFVLDDLMIEGSSSQIVSNLFTRGSHHRNLSVIFITQNLFHQGKVSRAISLNSSYIILMKNPRDKAQIMYLARQIYPENPKFFQDAYADATKEAYGYLLIDLKQNTPETCRLRTNIFPDNGFPFAYLPSSSSSSSSSSTKRRN